jgi:hypothetical protein
MTQFTYQLWLNDQFCLYESVKLSYVFHEYLSYNTNYNLLIKKKLNDSYKKFDLYLETIKYNKNNNTFISNNNKVYSISNIDYLNNLSTNQTMQTIEPMSNKQIKSTKIIDSKKYPVMPKVKIVDFDTNKESPNNSTLVTLEPFDEAKLQELEDLIENMENLKDEELEKLKGEEAILQIKDTEKRRVKMEERLVTDKKKELKNIFEADKRLYFNLSVMTKLVVQFKKDQENGIVDTRRPHELTKDELKAKVIVGQGRDFEIPVMFAHKFPIFKFMDEQNFINNEHSLLVYKMIYYNNYELKTESRNFFGDKVYLLNDEELNIYNSDFCDDEKLLIKNFTNELINKTIDVEKLISKSIVDTQDFFKKPLKKSSECEIEVSESETSDSESEEEASDNERLNIFHKKN